MGRGPRGIQTVFNPTAAPTRARTRASSKNSTKVKEPEPVLVEGTPYTKPELDRMVETFIEANHITQGDVVALEIDRADALPFAEALMDTSYQNDVRFEIIAGPDDTDTLIEQSTRMTAEDALFVNIQSYSPPDEAAPFHSGYSGQAESNTTAQENNSLRWSTIPWPTQKWAESVYPELPPDQAYRQLGQDLASFCRADGNGTWKEHIDKLHDMADQINEIEPQEIIFKSEGTELRMKPLEGSFFLPVEWETTRGKKILVNLPSQEVFGTPDPDSVEGHFSATKPLLVSRANEDGNPYSAPINGIKGRFENGKMVQIESTENPEENEYLMETFVRNPETGMSAIGEIGLVAPNNPIARTGRIYNNNNVDENATSHFGTGTFYPASLTPEAQAAGIQGNIGIDHKDMIFGSDDMVISMIGKDGVSRDIIKDGDWQDIRGNVTS